MIVIVVGVPGVGKTSVINEARKYLKYEFKVVNTGDIMFELAKEKYNINNRDEIRKKLTFEQQKEIQKEAIKRIKEMEKESDIILDTHLVIESYEGYIPGMLREYAEILRPDGIAVIISDPDKIFVRRLKDIQIRGRDIENLKRIEIQQNLTIYFTTIFMFEYGTIVEVINNEEGLLEEAAKKFAEFLNKLKESRLNK
ncbi:adenylate kinase [Candidatus Nanobsidianus stetteri]|uniref:Adenylate kinase n=1 Tax=Nanobsidianus stetteri TaxID=1294122 RepID=A0A2T9WM70_NANST|nr:adenylate kinase [Candidatus Nanobsidianus stetteri]MCC5446921.1 adenylate kinase [Candidatus Nanobsidianus stetteri]